MSETADPIDNEYYDILKVDREASFEEIKRSYRILAIRCHPDRNPGSADTVCK